MTIEKQIYNYEQIKELVIDKKLKKSIDVRDNFARVKFFGKGIENLLLDINNMKNTIDFINDYQFSISNRFNLLIPVDILCDLEGLREKYETIPHTSNEYSFKKFHEMTKKKYPYFDLCFYTLQHFKMADFIGFPGYEFHESEKFIVSYMKNRTSNFKVNPIQK